MKTGRYDLIFYRDGKTSAVSELADICHAESPIDAALHKASARNFFGRMSHGLLAFDADPAELQAVVSQTELLELYPLTPAYLARGYSADPQGCDAIVVCLLHTKDISGTEQEIRSRQNAVMQKAKDRFDEGKDSRWSS